MKKSEAYEKAAAEVTKSWVKNSFGEWWKDEGPVCALGALERVMTPQELRYEYDWMLLGYKVLDRPGYDERQRIADQICQYDLELTALAAEMYPDLTYKDDELLDSIAVFNDHDDITVEDVVAVLEKARVKAEEAGE